MAKRSNPFTGDGKASGITKGMTSHPSGKAVQVTAHERKRPVRRIHPSKLEPGGPEADVREADNAFAGAAVDAAGLGEQERSGLQRPGEKQVNHLKAAIGLMNRSRV